MALSATCYVLSDIGLTTYARQFPVASKIEQVMIATCINYIAAGLFFVPCCFVKHITLRDIWNTRYPAVTWVVAATLCIVGLNLSGLVSGTIIQSLRGVFAVVIAFVFYRHEIAGSGSNQTFIKKVVLAAIMVLAVALFYI